MIKETNVGVIGTGEISRILCTHIMNITNANLVAVADINSEVLKRVKEAYNLEKAYTNYIVKSLA